MEATRMTKEEEEAVRAVINAGRWFVRHPSPAHAKTLADALVTLDRIELKNAAAAMAAYRTARRENEVV